MNTEVWELPLAVLLAGLVVGAAVALLTRSRSKAQDQAAEAAALAAKKELLFEALRELEADRGKLDEATWAARKEALVERAARTLQAMEGAGGAAPMEAPAAPPAAAARAPRSPNAIVGAIALAFVSAAVGVMVKQGLTERTRGGSMTGGSQSAAPSVSEAAAEILKKDPDNLNALNDATWAAIQASDLKTAMATLTRAQKIAPEDPLVLTHLAILQTQVGMQAMAAASLQKALELRPGLSRALLWQAVLRYDGGDLAGAEESLRAVISGEATDDERQMAASMLTEIKAPPPQDRLSGKVRLADGLVADTQGTLFIIARRAAEGGGPPVAVRKTSAAALPMDFSLGDKDMVMGGAWPEQIWLQARIDRDGNPMTKGDDDLESPMLGPIASGAADLDLVISPK